MVNTYKSGCVESSMVRKTELARGAGLVTAFKQVNWVTGHGWPTTSEIEIFYFSSTE